MPGTEERVSKLEAGFDAHLQHDAQHHTALAREMGEINAGMHGLTEDTDRLVAAVFGTAQDPGLITNVTLIRTQVDRSSASWRWVTMAVLAAVAAGASLYAAFRAGGS